MNRRYQDDDDGQVDGDESAPAFRNAVQFQPGAAGQPWLRSPLPPWHMWGNTVSLQVNSLGLDPDHVAVSSQQMIKVSYKRPETWSFFFAARLLGTTPLSVTDTSVSVIFDLSTGHGRSAFQSQQPVPALPMNQPAFCKFFWVVPGGALPQAQPSKYTSAVPTPALDDRDATSTQVVEWLPAQDIQVSVRLLVLPILVPAPVVYTAEAHCFFAPRAHVRPDWFLKGPAELLFQGDEAMGR